ncbi:MAG: hypothetical protein ABSG24_02975 [Acidimicrobiales bacterium]|jgi:hypothetical protein
MPPPRFNGAQRVVIVIAAGAALLFFGDWVTALGSRSLTGWTGYAPLQSTYVPYLGGLHPWVRLVIWLALIALWAAMSIALLRSRPSGPSETS